MIQYRGLSIEKVTEHEITFVLCSHNVITLTIFIELGTGYRDGDRISVKIKDGGCTNWEGDLTKDAYNELKELNLTFDGNSESEMAATIFLLTGRVISYRQDGISMAQVAKMIQRRIDENAITDSLSSSAN
ncbi:MAG: hypothetical protein EOO88_55240 [Pedobacter sp.]|nr:MAG: hypothetical protein EOO88_55240 [Pedobacter sp.]